MQRQRIDNIQNPLHAEVMAIIIGVKLLWERDIGRVCVESDSKSVVNLIKMGASTLWMVEYGLWIF